MSTTTTVDMSRRADISRSADRQGFRLVEIAVNVARLPLLTFVACLSLAGCAGPQAAPDATETAATDALSDLATSESVELRGHVFSPSLVPVKNATVTALATD